MSENIKAVRAIFSEALEIADPQQRAEYLARSCGANTALRQSVEELLQANEDAGRFLGGSEYSVGPASLNAVEGTPLSQNVDGEAIRYFGDYRLVKEIARGGMGIVFKARQKTLNRTVALKLILAGKLAPPALVQRFHIEAEAAANLKHPNIVAIHEVGEHEGQHYFSMDYIEGQDLAQRMQQGAMSLKKAASCVQTIAQAIHYAHQRGVLHRDLKPSNILLDGQGQPHVTDFGLAKLIEHESSLTLSREVMGTPSYMAPEQVAGEKQLTVAADIYSLGAILYELLTGQPPFRASTALETMRQVMDQEPEQPSAVRSSRRTEAHPLKSEIRDPKSEMDLTLLTSGVTERLDRDLETICLKCLQKNPGGRYGSAEALAKDLGRWRAGEPILARPAGPWEKIWRWCKRNPKTAVLSASVILLLCTVAIGSTLAAVRIHKAQRAATEELFKSYLAQARAMRFSGQPGRRFDSLEVLAKAAAIRFAPELRDEAIACLALPDVKLQRRIQTNRGLFDSTLERYATVATNSGNISIRRVRDDQEILLLTNSAGPIERIGLFSHNGRFLPVWGRDRLLRVWDLTRGAVILTVPCAQRYESVDFQPDDQSVAVVAGQAEVSIYELATGEKVNSFSTPFAAICVRYDPSGRKLAISSFWDKRIGIVDANSGAILPMLTGEATSGEIAWHPRNSILAVAGKDALIYVWNTDTGELLHALKGHQSEPGNVAFSKDGDILISSGWDGTHLWHPRAGEHLMAYGMLYGGLESFAPGDDAYGHSRYQNGPLELLSFASGREAGRWHAAEEDKGNKVVTFSSDGRWLAFGAGDFVKLFETRTGDLLATLPTGPAAGVCFQKSGSGLLVSGRRGLFLWPIVAAGGAGELSIGPPRGLRSGGGGQEAVISEDGQGVAG